MEEKVKIPIELVDERYSSSIAQQQVLESVTSKKKRRNKGLIDKNAAAPVLAKICFIRLKRCSKYAQGLGGIVSVLPWVSFAPRSLE